MIRLTHYLYILSSWSFVAEAAVQEARTRFGDAVEYDWRIAIADLGADGPYTREQLQFFYDRLEAATGQKMNLGWWKPDYNWTVPDRVAIAARLLGATGSGVRLALARAALTMGQPVTDLEVALEIAAEAGDIDVDALAAQFHSSRTVLEMCAWSQEFQRSGVQLRPAFKLENDLADSVILSGIWTAQPLLSAIDALLTDELSFKRFLAEREGSSLHLQ